MIDYFPLSMASGSAFCNRTIELEQLKNNLALVRPTLVVSPRRYGKTSLVFRALEKSNLLYAHIDFYKVLDEDDVLRSILNGIGKLLTYLESRPKALFRLVSDFFSDLNINIHLGNQLNISIEAKYFNRRPVDIIQATLIKLHNLAKTKNIKLVFYIDEFQKLSQVTNNHAIEAGIRELAQQSKHVIYIFSGSNRHLIEDMFFDNNRPFYKLCDTIYLQRIAPEHYLPYITKAFKAKWEKALPETLIMTILQLCESHPYYVNLLCSKLWLRKFPTVESIKETWHQCALENRPQIEREIDMLSVSQRKLLISLSRFGPTKQPTGKEFSQKANLASSTITQALEFLLKKDYVYKNNDGFYKVLDPMFCYLFK